MDMNKLMNVKNRSASLVVYKATLDNGMTLRREIRPGETIKVPYEELVKLSYQPGGRTMMESFLLIEAEEAREDLSLHTELEYDMNEAQIIELLRSGSMDAFLDCLDFAPTGVMDLVKKYAVELPLNDSAKREALKNKTGFDVSRALENNAPEVEDLGQVEAPAATRRVQPATSTPGRRTEGKYKVVSQQTTEG
jgi:hypothetical protein